MAARGQVYPAIELGIRTQQHFAGTNTLGGQSAIGLQAAADIGLDADDIRGALASDQDVAEVEQEAQQAKEAGIEGVPCFIIGGKFAVSGAQAPDYLADAIERVAQANREAAE